MDGVVLDVLIEIIDEKYERMKLAENGRKYQYHLGARTRDPCLERADICSHVLPVSYFSSILSMRTSRTTLSTDRLISHRQQRSKTLGSGAPRLRGALLRTRGVARRRARHPLARLLRLVLLARPLLGERVLGQHSAAGLPLGHSLHLEDLHQVLRSRPPAVPQRARGRRVLIASST